MILTSEKLNLLLNSKLILNKYPVLEKIVTKVKWDGDKEMPWYEVIVNFYLKEGKDNFDSFNVSIFDPHEFIFEEMDFLLAMVGVSTRDISQIFVRVRDHNGELIY